MKQTVGLHIEAIKKVKNKKLLQLWETEFHSCNEYSKVDDVFLYATN